MVAILILDAEGTSAQRGRVVAARPRPMPGALEGIRLDYRNRFENLDPREFNGFSLDTSSPQLRLAAPRRVQSGIPFDVDLWLFSPRASLIGADAGVTAFAAPSRVVSYDPQQIELTPNRPQRLKVVVSESGSGLATLEVATSIGSVATAVVDAGFNGAIRAELKDVLESNTVHVVTLGFIDQDGRPLPLDAPVIATVKASKAMLRNDSINSWSEDLAIAVPAGSRTLPAFELRPQSWTATEGVLQVQVALADDYVLADASFRFGILPWGWAQLALSILGGLLYGTYALLKRRNKQKRRQAIAVIASAGLAGLIAYLLATWNILGIKVDTTSLRAFVLLGFLFAYLGVDVILRTVVEKSGSATNAGSG